MIESENFHEDSKTVEKPTNPKGKSKVGAVTVDNTAQQFNNCKVQSRVKPNCYRVVSKIPKYSKFHNMYLTQYKTTLTLYHRLLKVKILLILKVVEVAEVATEVEVVEVEVGEEEV